MNLPDFLTEWPGNNIVLTGHRIGLYHVVTSYKEGMSVEQLHEEYPTLEPELIQKVLDFYHANQAEVDTYVAETRAELDRQYEELAASPRRINREELLRRYEEKKRARGG
jgi:uncharacterized protein (DUF433 family)